MCKIRIRPSYEIYNDLTSEDYIQLYKKWLLENSSDCSEKTARMVAEEAHKINASEQILVLISYECNIDTTEANKNVIRLRKFIKWKNWKSLLRKRGIAHRLQDLYDPRINVRATEEIISYLYKKHITPPKVMKKYFGGYTPMPEQLKTKKLFRLREIIIQAKKDSMHRILNEA